MRKVLQIFNFKVYLRLCFLVVMYLMTVSVFAQETVTVKGTITDENGETLPGATVQVKGTTTTGTITDIEGNYSLNAPSDGVLVVSFVGFQTSEKNINGRNQLDFILSTDAKSLEEVVVVGYGTQRKEQIVGSVAQMDGGELQQRGNVTNISDALSGSIPGVTVLTGTGVPGGNGVDGYNETQILIRGRATWNNSGPLILVDGVERDMNDVDPASIKSVTVLKDASATAQFGVKGANGVIQITTKRGQTGKPSLMLDVSTAWKNVSRVEPVVDAYTGIQARNYAIIQDLNFNPGGWSSFVPEEQLNYYKTQQYPNAFPNQNWRDIMLRDAGRSHRVNMNVSGGGDFVKYFTSLSYLHDGDIVQTEDVGQGYDAEFKYDRFNFRTNLDFSPTKTTTFSVNLGGYFGKQQTSGAAVPQGVWYGLYRQAPDVPVFRYDDGIFGNGNSTYERLGANRFVDMNFSGTKSNIRAQAFSDFKLTQDLDVLAEGLSVTAQYSFDNYYETNGRSIDDDGTVTKYVDPAYYTSSDELDIEDYTTYFYPIAYANSSHGFDYYDRPLNYRVETINAGGVPNKATQTKRKSLYRATINYNRVFGSHEVGALALFQREEDLQFSGQRAGFALKREDWVGSVNYNFEGTYFVEFNAAYNGSDQFGPGYKFEFFPSAAVGYRISEYDFFKDNLPFMNHFKVRYSWGIVGNDKVGGLLWPYVSQWDNATGNDSNWGFANPNNNYNVIDGPQIYEEGVPGNPDLRWETSTKHNFGVETGFFNNIITANVDVFWENRTDILIAANQRVAVPVLLGITPPAANLGETENKGFEIVVGHEGAAGDFSYWATASYTHVKDKIIIKEDPVNAPAYQKEAGYQINQQRATLHSGIITSWDDVYTGVVGLANNNLLPGDYRYVDFNANGIIDPLDNVPYGYPTRPQNTYNLNLGMSYKGFSVSALFYGANNVTQQFSYPEFDFDAPVLYQTQIDETFSPEYGNSNPTYRALAFQRNSGRGTYDYKDGSFLRLKTAEIAYTIPSQYAQKIGMQKTRIYVNGNNLLYWGGLLIDFEGDNFEVRNYPVTRQINVGVNMTF